VALYFGPALRPISLKATLKTLGQKIGPYIRAMGNEIFKTL